MPENTGTPAATDQGATDGDFVIPGLPFKAPEEVAKGYKSLESKLGEQGAQMGNLKAQLAQATALLEKTMGAQGQQKPTAPAGPDYDTEISKIDQAIEKLDIDDPTYSKQLAQLNRQARALEAQKVQTMTEQKLMGHFEKTLSERDAQQAQQGWKSQNPDFETPEMQQAIQQHMAQDRTGMMDPVLAYREIQLQQTQSMIQQLKAENDDFRNRLKLKSGEAEVGKVVTKTGGTPAASNQPKLTGAALKAGALEAFMNAS